MLANALRHSRRLAPQLVNRYSEIRTHLKRLRSLVTRLQLATPRTEPLPPAVTDLLNEIACAETDAHLTLNRIAAVERAHHDAKAKRKLKHLANIVAFPAPQAKKTREASWATVFLLQPLFKGK